MLKITKETVLSITLILALSGCGSSSSSNASKDNNTTSNSGNLDMGDANNSFDTTDVNNRVEDIRRGFYVDSAVEGVDYKCGEQNGTTDSNGTFRFEAGKECLFTLGNIVLREFNTTELEDNVVIVEKDIDNARLLQTLDNDGDSDNGIKITRAVLDTIKDNNSSLVPVGDEQLDGIFRNAQTAEGYDGAMVTVNEAKSHISQTLANLGLDDYLDTLDELSGVLDSMDNDSNSSGFFILKSK